MPQVYDIIIVGGGPAGLAAALYAARGRHTTLVLEKALPGGKIVTTERVDDYPGYPEGIGGAELGQAMGEQAAKFGAEILMAEVTGISLTEELKTVHTSEGDFTGRTAIISCGGQPNHLGVPGEREFDGKGVSYSAQCSAIFFQDKPVVVVGGGDTALTAALCLAQNASKVTVVHRRSRLRAIEVLQEEAHSNPKIEFLWNSVVEEILGNEVVTGLRIRNLISGSMTTLKAEGVFITIGFCPNTDMFRDLLPLQETGHIRTDEWMATGVPGIFAAGDVRTDAAQQVITAAGDGATAAIAADHYLSSLKEGSH